MRGRRAAAQRHALLSNLQQLVFGGVSTAEAEQIVSRLYETNIDILEECLLQVSHVCITHQDQIIQDQLQNFMLWLAGRSLQVALRLSWTVDAVSGFYDTTGLGNRVKNIQDKVESYAINQGNPAPVAPSVADQTSSDGQPGAGNTEEEMDVSVVQRKEIRLKVFNDERAFVATLTDMSDMLRFFPDRNRRKDELRKRLRVLNERLPSMRLVHPLATSTDPVRWIVNIAVEECTVFSSRERAPYLIRYEVIVDDTATMQDPTTSRLRQSDGSFKVTADEEDIFVPGAPAEEGSPDAGDPLHASPSGGASLGPSNETLSSAFGESTSERMARVRRASPWGKHPKWSMSSMIVKAGDDLRQEELALQLIYIFNSIWQESGLTCRVKPYVALPTGADCGLLEVVDDSSSMDGIKKSCRVSSIYNFFAKAYDGEGSRAYQEAQSNFVESMAGYSVISYIIQIKDRHNGNLMITRDGMLVHIDFGFLFVTSPGGINFESAPFKLSQELIDVMGGVSSDVFAYYKVLFFEALEAAREQAEDLLALVSIMTPCNAMPCFGTDPNAVVGQLRNRLRHDLVSEADYAIYAKDLIVNSADNWRTRRYDQFQTLQNGIL